MTVESAAERIVYLTFYHPFLFLFVWAYWQTVFTDPLHPRQEYFLTREEVHKVYYSNKYSNNYKVFRLKMLQLTKKDVWHYVKQQEIFKLKIAHLVVLTDIVFIQNVSSLIDHTIAQEQN